MNSFIKFFKIIFVFLILQFIFTGLQSQPPSPNGNAGQNGPMGGQAGGGAPLDNDGGVLLLLAFAIGYGFIKTISLNGLIHKKHV